MTPISISCVLVALSASRAAQCLDWTRGYPPPGTIDGAPPFNDLASVEAMVVDDTSVPATLILGGTFSGADTVTSANTVRWDGTQYHALHGLDAQVLGLWRIDLGGGPEIYAGTRDFGPASLWRLVEDVWQPIPGLVRPVKTLVAFDSGHGLELHVASGAQFGGLGQAFRLSPSGWVQLDGLLNLPVEELAVFDDGGGPALYAVGNFAGGIARWSNGTWVEVGGGLTRAKLSPASPRALVVHDFGAGPRLVVGGLFDNAGNLPSPSLAAWDGANGSTVVPGLDRLVLDLDSVVLPGGPALAISGPFTTSAGGSALSPLLVQGGNVIELGPSLGTVPNSTDAVNVFVAHDDGHGPSLFVGGQFDRAGADPAADIARWDGTDWHALTAPDGIVGGVIAMVRHDDGSGPAIYVGGSLIAVGGTLHREVGRFDGTNWTTVGPPSTPNGTTIHALASTDVGAGRRLYAGGDFSALGGAAATALASWDGTAWSELAGGALAYPPYRPVVSALATLDDGTGPALYVGGHFTQAGPATVLHVA